MQTNEYYAEDKCTTKIAQQIMGVSEKTTLRYLQKLRRDLGVKPYGFVSIAEFCRQLYSDGRLEWSCITLLHRT